VTNAGQSTPNVELRLRPTKHVGSTRIFCATCRHSESVHADASCLYSVCDCDRFVVGASLEASARSPSLASGPSRSYRSQRLYRSRSRHTAAMRFGTAVLLTAARSS
jgi:hypothetical protein